MMKNFLIGFVFLCSTLTFGQITQDLGDFNALKISDRIELKLIPSEKNYMEISGEKAEDVKLITKNNQLVIRMDVSQFLKGEDVVVLLYYKNLKEIIADRGAMISAEEVIKNPRIKIVASKGSDVRLQIETENLEVRVNTGAEVYLSGHADQQEVISNSGGNYDGEELKTQHTKVTVNAGGQADIFATKNVEAKTRAGGSIHIWGGAEVDQKKIAGGNIKIHK